MVAIAAASPAGPDRMTLAAFLGVVLFGGVNAIAVKLSVEELAPFWSAGLRFIAAGLLLVGIVALTGRSFPRGRSLSGAALYGLLAFAASFAFIYPALRQVPAGTAMVLISLVPLMTFGFAILHGQERFQIQGLMGALIALSGVAIVVADQLDAAVPLISLLLIIAGVAFIAESGVILKGVPRSDPFATNAVAIAGWRRHPPGDVEPQRGDVELAGTGRDVGVGGLPGRLRLDRDVRLVPLRAAAMDGISGLVRHAAHAAHHRAARSRLHRRAGVPLVLPGCRGRIAGCLCRRLPEDPAASFLGDEPARMPANRRVC